MPNGRQMDGKLSDGTWYEAKSAFNYLFNHSDDSLNMQKWNSFTSQITNGRSQALEAGAKYELITNVTPPIEVINWVNKKNITLRIIE